MAEMKRKQTTSIILMGVIGAEFGQEMEPARRKEEPSLWNAQNQNGNVGKQVQDGFGIAQALARQTSEELCLSKFNANNPVLFLSCYLPITALTRRDGALNLPRCSEIYLISRRSYFSTI